MVLLPGLEQLFAIFCTCLGGWVVNSCCMHTEALVILIFQASFFKTTMRNRGLWGDINLPDNQVPQSHGPLPTNRNQEEVFQPVNHPGRRHPDRRRNLYSMPGQSRDSSNQEEQEQGQREEHEQQQRERAEAERQEQEQWQREDAERQEEEQWQWNQAEAERQEQAWQEAEEQRQREEQARCEDEQRQQQEEEHRQQQEEAARQERERDEAEQLFREEQEQRREEEAERQRQQDSSGSGGQEHFLQQVMQQSGTQTCYAASVCAVLARLGLHQHLQAVAASPGSHLLHLAFIRALSALLDSTSPRPTAETVVTRLNFCLDPSGRDERYNLYRQQCASEFVRDILGEAINAQDS